MAKKRSSRHLERQLVLKKNSSVNRRNSDYERLLGFEKNLIENT